MLREGRWLEVQGTTDLFKWVFSTDWSSYQVTEQVSLLGIGLRDYTFQETQPTSHHVFLTSLGQRIIKQCCYLRVQYGRKQLGRFWAWFKLTYSNSDDTLGKEIEKFSTVYKFQNIWSPAILPLNNI